MKSLTWHVVVCTAMVLGGCGLARADERNDGCSMRTLKGTYVFSASGFNIVAGVAQPKAIVEVIRFNGDGTLSVPAATLSANGAIIRIQSRTTARERSHSTARPSTPSLRAMVPGCR
jgi:hypothetical protein